MSATRSRVPRVVFDTNVLISAALAPGGIPRRVVDYMLTAGSLLFSAATHGELADVIERPHLQRYLSEVLKAELLNKLTRVAIWIEPSEPIVACRDPKDDKFLEVAVSGKADYLVTGDKDLLVLHSFRGIPILTPVAFLAEMEKEV